MNPGLILRFVLAGLIGAGGAVGIGALTANPQPASLAKPAPDFQLTADTGDQPVAFGLTAIPDTPPIKLQAVPDDAQIQLVAFSEPGTTPGSPSTGGPGTAAWLSAGHSRVPVISQFDGGPLQGSNCTMASGAMLARLVFGIVTKGSSLRALQPDQQGGTSLVDLNNAINRYGVHFDSAAITPLQLRALMYAGAGAVIQGTYGAIPVSLRLQKDFTGGHAIYLDGFRPASSAGPAAYYVDDPLGPTWAGYSGAWWPADLVEAFATSFGGGRIYTAWGFPGGGTPTTYPTLPPDSYPGAGTTASPSPTVAPSPTAPGSPEPSASPSPIVLPSPDASPSVPPAGNNNPSPPPGWWIPVDPNVLVAKELANIVVGACATSPAPAYCPPGIIGQLPPNAVVPSLPPLANTALIKLLYANPIGGGQMQVIFSGPTGSIGALQYWDAGGTGGLHTAPAVVPALLNGQPVFVATFPIAQGAASDFVAFASGTGVHAISQVGTAGP